ncbi:MAG: hypothetical protein WC413_01580 [Candidatus Nanoarchaeia archaeon]
MKDIKNYENMSKFKKDLTELILRADKENLEKLREAYPELVKELRN